MNEVFFLLDSQFEPHVCVRCQSFESKMMLTMLEVNKLSVGTNKSVVQTLFPLFNPIQDVP